MKPGQKPKYFAIFAGKKLTYPQLATETGLSLTTLYARRRDKSNLTQPKKLIETITHKGETLSISEWAKKLDLLDATIRRRIKDGWPTLKVLSQKRFKGMGGMSIPITWRGKTFSMTGWAKEFGVSRQRISKLLQRYPVDEAFSRYNKKRTG
jgi:hypothetical protein